MQLLSFKKVLLTVMVFITNVIVSQDTDYTVELSLERNKLYLIIQNKRDNYFYFFDKKIEETTKKSKVLYAINKASIYSEKDFEVINLSSKLNLEEYFVSFINFYLRKGRFVNKQVEPYQFLAYKIKIKGLKRNKPIKVILTINNEDKEFIVKQRGYFNLRVNSIFFSFYSLTII